MSKKIIWKKVRRLSDHTTPQDFTQETHTHNIPPYPARPNSHPCTSKQLKKTNTRTQRPATSSKRINPPKQPVHANHGGKRVLRCMVSLSDQRGLQQRTCSASASGSWYRKPSPGCSPHNFQPRVRKAARPSPSSRKQGRHGWQGLDGGRPIKLIDFGFSVVGQPIEPEPLRLLFQESPTHLKPSPILGGKCLDLRYVDIAARFRNLS